MTVVTFCEKIRKILPCITIYYPRDAQVVVYLNVNNKQFTLCYDEEFIKCNGEDTIFLKVEDDLYLIGIEVNIVKRDEN